MDKLLDKKFLTFIAAFVCGGVALALAGGTGLAPEGQRLLASLVVIMVLWASGCINLSASCLLLLVLMSVSVTDFSGTKKGLTMGRAFGQSLSGFSSAVPMAVIAGTAFAAVIRSSGLAERIVYLIMKLVAGKSGKATPNRMLAALFLADLPASLMIPAATGRCALYMSIAEGFERPFGFARIDSGEKFNPFQKAVWLAVALIPIIMGGAFLTSAEATIMVGGLIEQGSNVPQFWASTFCVLYFPALGAMFISWFVLCRLFPSNIKEIEATFISDQLAKLGPLSYKEKYCLVALLAMIGLFLTDHIHRIPATLVLVLMSFVLFIPGIGAGSWKKEGKQIAWDGFFIISVALSFSTLLTKFKVMNYFADGISSLNIESYPLVLLAMILATLLIRLGIASITSAAALLVPIAMVVGTAAKLNPEQIVALAWITYIFCRISFFLPHQGAQLIMTYGVGFYDVRDLSRAAIYITVGCVALYMVWGVFCVEPILNLIR